MIPEEYYSKLAQVESSNNPLEKNPNSSAKGKYQFVEGTARQYGLDKVEFGTPEYVKAEEAAVRKFTSDNYSFLKEKLNREPTKGELYLAHQQGASGALKLISGGDDENAAAVLGLDEVKNNGGDENITLSEFKNKWTSKFDDIEASERGLNNDASVSGDGRDNIDVDPFADFGVTISDNQPDPFADFNVTIDSEFIPVPDGVGGLKSGMIDQSTGAPSYIRQVVGSLYDPESRLATLQKYYPDAQPYGDNNFIYTDPETRKPTLYNPKGLDSGDAASLTKEAFVATASGIGAFIGGVGGGITSIPTAGVASPATVSVGVVGGGALGAGIGSLLYDSWMTITGQTQDVRSLSEKAFETGVEIVGAGTGEVVGRAIPVVAKGAIGGAKATSRAIVQQFERLGIRPTMTATGGATAGRIEASLAQNVMSAGVMQKQADEVVEQSGKALQGIIKKYGKPKTKQGAGIVIFEAAGRAVERIEGTTTKLYDKAFDLVGPQAPVTPVATKQLMKDLTRELAKAPQAKGRTYKPALEKLNAIMSDSKTIGLDFETLRSIRTDIGRDLADPLSSGATSSQNLAMKRVYAALSDDMGRTANEAGQEAANAISRADKYRKAYAETAEKTLNKILKYDAEEKAYKFALSASKDGGTSLSKLRKLFTQGEWDDVSATVLSQLGENPTGGADSFSIGRFVSNYNKLAPEAKTALFKGGRYKEASAALDDFADLMEKLKDAGRYENTSNTAGAIQVNMMINALAQGGAGALAGAGTGIGGVAGAAGAVVAPRAAAKLMTNPRFIKWLSKPVTSGAQDIGAHLTKLIAIGEANPELKEGINEFINALDANTKK